MTNTLSEASTLSAQVIQILEKIPRGVTFGVLSGFCSLSTSAITADNFRNCLTLPIPPSSPFYFLFTNILHLFLSCLTFLSSHSSLLLFSLRFTLIHSVVTKGKLILSIVTTFFCRYQLTKPHISLSENKQSREEKQKFRNELAKHDPTR